MLHNYTHSYKKRVVHTPLCDEWTEEIKKLRPCVTNLSGNKCIKQRLTKNIKHKQLNMFSYKKINLSCVISSGLRLSWLIKSKI